MSKVDRDIERIRKVVENDKDLAEAEEDEEDRKEAEGLDRMPNKQRLQFLKSDIKYGAKNVLYWMDDHNVQGKAKATGKAISSIFLSLIKRIFTGILGLYAKWQLNAYLADIDADAKDKDEEISDFGWRIRGFLILILIVFFLFLKAEIGLLLAILVMIALYALRVQMKYSANATKYNYKIALKWAKMTAPALKNMPANVLYYAIPQKLIETDLKLEKKYGNPIIDSELITDDHYTGFLREIRIDLDEVKIDKLSDILVTRCALIPQASVRQDTAFAGLQGSCVQDLNVLFEVKDLNELNAEMARDDRINGKITELTDIKEQRKEQERLQAEKEAEEAELQGIKDYCANHGLSEKVAPILMTIAKNKDSWRYNTWKLAGDSCKGNDRYFSVRCRLLQGASIKDIQRIKPQLESAFRRQALISPLADRGSFTLTVLLDSNLPKYTLSMADVKRYGDNNQLILGDTLTGFRAFKMNNQANHIGVFGKSGVGKSLELRALIASFLSLKDYDYRNLLIVSSSKVGDFADLKRAGAYVGAGLDECLKVSKAVLAECLRREKLFATDNVANLWEYNAKYPDKPLKRILFVFDELENALNSSDTKQSKAIEQVLVEALNLMRSEGVNLIVGAQNALKSQIGVVMDKLTVRFIGNANKNVLDQFDPSLSDYFKTCDSVQGRFFVEADNLKTADTIGFGDTGLVLTQTPYINDMSASTLPNLAGQDFMAEAVPAGTQEVADSALENDDGLI